MQKTNVLSFKELKQRISLEHVLRYYGLFEGLTLRGKSHRGPCPFCDAKEGTPFSVSLEKQCYQCFACHASGNILDFVAKWEGVSIREAGQILAKNCVEEKESLYGKQDRGENHRAGSTTDEGSRPACSARSRSGESGRRSRGEG